MSRILSNLLGDNSQISSSSVQGLYGDYIHVQVGTSNSDNYSQSLGAQYTNIRITFKSTRSTNSTTMSLSGGGVRVTHGGTYRVDTVLVFHNPSISGMYISHVANTRTNTNNASNLGGIIQTMISGEYTTVNNTIMVKCEDNDIIDSVIQTGHNNASIGVYHMSHMIVTRIG